MVRECLPHHRRIPETEPTGSGYEPAEDDATSSDASTEAKSIDKIDYTDVVSFANWMKNVE